MVEEETEEEAWEGRVRLTDWGIIAPGEGGNKVASLFFSTRNNAAIEKRILLINTAEADILKAAKAVSERVESEKAKVLLTDIMSNNKEIFGKGRGAGNFWPEGENSIKEDFDGDETVRRRIDMVGLSACPAVCDIFTLGGGTGCGSGPYIVYRTKKDEITMGKHFAIAIWPEIRDGGQLQNAYPL